MATIKSDLTSKKYPQSSMRQFEVSDESEEVYDYSQDEGPPPDGAQMDVQAINARLASRGLPPLDQAGAKAAETRQNIKQESVREYEQKVSDARKVKASGKERLTDSARRRIEMLCGMLRCTKEVTIDGNVFVLRTLKGKEIREAVVAASAFDGTVELPFESRKNILGRSLVQVGGVDVELFLGDDSLEARMEFLEELDEPILERIHAGYVQLVAETEAKYTVKTDADAKEVISDIKK